MSEKITVQLVGEHDVIEREVDEVNPAVREYVVLSPNKREVYHFEGYDERHQAVYRYQGIDEIEYPTISDG